MGTYFVYPSPTVPAASFPLLAADGTAAAPSYSDVNYPTTGVYFSATDVFNVSCAGVRQFFISSTAATFAGTLTVGSLSGVVHSTAGLLSASNVVLTSEVSGVLPVANGGTALSSLGTANQLLGVNAGATAAEYKTLSGTSNQITVTHGVGTVTLATPQSIASGSSPTFAGLTLTAFSGFIKATAGALGTSTISLTADVTGTLPIGNGGTGQTTKGPAFDALSPMTTLGDVIYGGASGTGTRLAGNITTTNKFLSQVGNASISAAPAWNALVAGDIPSLSTTILTSGTLSIARGGTNSATALNNNRVIQSSGSAIVEAAAITASRALISDANGIPTHSATTSTELGYVSGVTSALQTQINLKQGGTATGKSADYVVLDADGIYSVLMTTSNTDRTVTLPLAANNTNRVLAIVKIDSGTGIVTIDGNGSETIVGNLTVTLLAQNEFVVLQCDGTTWNVLSKNIRTYLESDATGAYVNTNGGSGNFVNLTSKSIPKGTWEFSATTTHIVNTAVANTYFGAAISTNSGATTTDHVPGKNDSKLPVILSSIESNISIAQYKLALAATTTVYLKAINNYSSGIPQATGILRATRVDF